MVAPGVFEDRNMAIKLKVQQLMDATIIISQIIRENRPLPQKGKYRLARMHPVLNKEFLIVDAQRNEMINAYNYHAPIPNPAYKVEAETLAVASGNGESNVTPLVPKFIPSPEFSVPEDKLQEFLAAWNEIAQQELEVDVQPIPLEQLCLPANVDGSISGHELIVLGDIIAE